jgi:hypothetical protein
MDSKVQGIDTKLENKITEIDALTTRLEQAGRDSETLQSRVIGLTSLVTKAQLGLNGALIIVDKQPQLLEGSGVSPADIKNAAHDLKSYSENASYRTFLHYNRSDITSGSYAEHIRTSLSEQGFVVAGASGDSTVKHEVTDTNEGPHVSFFVADNCPDPKKPHPAAQDITPQEQMAKRIADFLNTDTQKPAGYGTFVVKCHSNYPSQVSFLGLWL